MKQKPASRRHAGRTIFLTLGSVLVLLAIAFFAYVNDYRHADETAQSLLQSSTSIRQEGNMTILTPDAARDSGAGLISTPAARWRIRRICRCLSPSARAA